MKPRGRIVAIDAAVPLLLAVTAATAAVLLSDPPSAEQFAASDPLVRLAGAALGPWQAIIASLAVAAVWLSVRHPTLASLRRAFALFATGAAIAVAGALMIRLIAGPHLPPFVPPEESAAPGLGLGLSAGLLEEAVFRFALLATLCLIAKRSLPDVAAAALAIVATGFAFAVTHELGATTPAFDAAHFATRVVFPGCVMSALFFRPGPAFILGLHWTAHIAICLLFGSAG